MRLDQMRIRSDSEIERLSQLKQDMEDGKALDGDGDPKMSGIILQMKDQM